jgi:hypothetical protein
MRMSLRYVFAPLALTAITACSSTPDTPTPSPTSAADLPSPSAAPATRDSLVAASRLRKAIRADEASVIAIETSRPRATCKLEATDTPTNDDSLTLFADDDGVVTVTAHPIDPRASTGSMHLDCADDAGRFDVPFDVVVTADAPHATATPAPKGRIRPPLAADPLSLSSEELVAGGLPPRPDLGKDPAQYAKWTEMASRTLTVIEPRLVETPKKHGRRKPAAPVTDAPFGNSENWCGYAIAEPQTTYRWIYGSWAVPSTSPEGGFSNSTYVANWVGLDGAEVDSEDVVQAGTMETTSNRLWISYSNDYAWTEWFPATSKAISNFPVSAGDVVDVWVWLTDANGNSDVKGGFGNFTIYNSTKGTITTLRTAAPSGITFLGNTAEWITERPTIGSSSSDLANFAPYTISSAYAWDTNDVIHDYGTDAYASQELDMYNGNTLLATVAPTGPRAMEFVYYAHR